MVKKILSGLSKFNKYNIINLIWLIITNTIYRVKIGGASMSNLYVVAMGVGTVFAGLICLIILTSVMGLICRPRTQKAPKQKDVKAAPNSVGVIENRQEIVAAVSAVIAEELGTDVSAIRIHSFRKI